ncbi:MAG TPA: proton-conducting transporter membrane subunit [Candidatus Dormibacteraeota bacterium]|nr:proton-conducting transporter membrane subunit [Candidatus Dormibacteraeota bacterium]
MPFATFVLALSSVRTRRSASATTMLGTFVTLALTLLVGWALTRKSTSYVATYQYINLSVAFAGPTNFQNFAIDLVMHVDHMVIAALIAIELCVLGAVGWHQVMGRSEAGAARFHAVITGLLFASVGVLVSYDLAELFGFWAIGGALTFLLLAHRWGLDEPASRARVALALPFLTDLCLLCGIAWLYARYGTQNLNTLLPILHTNPGWTVRSLVVASVLLLLGIAGRLALWPFTFWITQTAVTAPPAASAIAQAVWSVLGIAVLYRVMPIIVASNAQTIQVFLVAIAIAAIAASVIALLGNEPRRSIALAGSTAVAIGAAVVVSGFRNQSATFAVAGFASVLALAPARAAAWLAASSISSAMRTDDLVDMGDAWNRMRGSATGLLASTVVMGLAATGALVYGLTSRSRLGVALGEAVVLMSVAAVRVWLAASLGPLRRRRAFEPDRVREVQPQAVTWPYWLTLGGAVFLVASLITGWLTFLDGAKHPSSPPLGFAVWVIAAVVGFVACALAYVANKDAALAASARAGAWLRRGSAGGYGVVDRFLVAPSTDIARRVGDWIPAGDSALGRFAGSTGELALAAMRLPAVPVLVLVAVVLAIVVALVGPGVIR